MVKQYELNPVHIGSDRVRIDEVDAATYEPRYSTRISDMQTFVVGVGFDHTYISYGTRREYKTYENRINDFKRQHRVDANHNNDTLLYYVTVYAHNRLHVIKLYER